MDIFCYLCSCLSCFLVCSSQPCGHLLGKSKHLGSLECDVSCVLTVLGQLWYLIVSLPDLCLLTYFHGMHSLISHAII